MRKLLVVVVLLCLLSGGSAAQGPVEVVDTFTGDGVQTFFPLTYPLASSFGYVTNGGINETLAIQGDRVRPRTSMATLSRDTVGDMLDQRDRYILFVRPGAVGRLPGRRQDQHPGAGHGRPQRRDDALDGAVRLEPLGTHAENADC